VGLLSPTSGQVATGSHARFYRGLLRFYPTEFRARYGDEMVQLFGDQLRDATAKGRPFGPATIWFRTLADLVTSAASEHLQRDRMVAHSLGEPPSMATKALGTLGVVGGFVLILAFVPNVPLIWDLVIVRLVLFNAGAIAIGLAIHRRQAPRSPILSLAAAAPMILANAWYLVMLVLSIGRPVYPEPDPQFRQIFFYAAIALWLSDATFGLVALRLGVVSRWAAAALTVGSLGALSGVGGLPFITGPFAAIVFPFSQIGIALNGIAWIALGLGLLRPQRIPVPPRSLPTPPPG
jgi:hypothetical protein